MNEDEKPKIPPPPVPPPPPAPPTTGEKTPEPEKKVVVRREKEIIYRDNKAEIKPPHAEELEIAVIGALLTDFTAAQDICDVLAPEIFFYVHNRKIYQAIRRLYFDRSAIDLLTVSEELRRVGELENVGGNYYLVECTQQISSAAHIEFHSRILMQKYILRELLATSYDCVDKVFYRDPDVFDLMDKMQQDLLKINEIAVQGTTGKTLTPQEEFKLRREEAKKGIKPGVDIGVDNFDEWSGGFHRRELITIAGRPGMGKTTVVLSICCQLSIDKGVRTALFSLEMSKTDLHNRVAARMTGIPYKKIRNIVNLTPEEEEMIDAALERIETLPIKIFDTTEHHNNFEKLIGMIKEEVSEGAKIVFIDYVQLIELTTSRGSETSDLNVITKKLKALANELNVPIIMLAQLNRDVDKRPDKRPVLADLKQSGSIEQDSDTVIFLLRPAYYEQKESTVELPPHVQGKTNFIVAKGRNIGTNEFETFQDFRKYEFVAYREPF